ncbi:Phosphoenolpyruvate-dependent phosphotransferase system [bacterium HR40]|nr:Phosphoenolpyruvate-dependent phosphotransferase system [bacterium HR40]
MSVRAGRGESSESRTGETRRPATVPGARPLLRQLVALQRDHGDPQTRLDRIVRAIAANLVADVCSLYILRAGDQLELFASEGLAPESVHVTRLAVGQGLVGTIAARGEVIATDDAFSHPNFLYRPETREEQFRSFLGVPIVRGGRVLGVLVVQNRAARRYHEEEIEALQIIATVLAEILVSGGILDPSRFTDIEMRPVGPVRLDGVRLVDGIGIGRAWLHAPRIEIGRLVAEDPEAEIQRLEQALAALRRSLDAAIAEAERARSDHREILEVYRMFADDTGWLRRMHDAILTGLSAEAAVRRIQEENRLHLEHASDPYLRERLQDLDDIANRLLLHLAGRDPVAEARAVPEGTVLVARDLTATELVAFDPSRLRAIVLEEGSPTAHVTLVARSFGLPMVGRVEGAMTRIEPGDPVAVDAGQGLVVARPDEDMLEAFAEAERVRRARSRTLDALRFEPCVTRDGVRIHLHLNAAFPIELDEVRRLGADGCGLFRTEFAFIAAPSWPNWREQARLYGQVLDRAGDVPVLFRTLDIGSDKPLAYWRMPSEANPAMGWRGLRTTLDRPSVLRQQLRALLYAARGRRLSLMFPMVAEVGEFVAARRVLELELEEAKRRGWELPTGLEVGAMFEVPALFWQLEALCAEADFLSVGSNDLVQFLFAADRGSPRLVDRYDVLAPAALSLFRDLARRCAACGVRLSVCGEMASRPLEAMALVAVGLRHLSVAPSELLAVKATLRALDLGRLTRFVDSLLQRPRRSLRSELEAYARDHAVPLPLTHS